MGSPPKPLLVLVTLALVGCGAGGFSLGFLQAQPHRAAAEEEAPIAGKLPPGAVIKDAQPLAEPPPPPPPAAKAKKPDDEDASDQAASDAAPPAAKLLPAPPPPAEAAPGAPPSLTPATPKLPDDLPPT